MKAFSTILVSQTQNFVRISIIMLIIAICLLMGKKPLNLNLTIKMLTFQLNFVSKVYLMDLVLFSANYNWVDKSDTLNIDKYLMNKNNIR